MAPRIVLVAINARYSHTAHGIRCLAANMGDLKACTTLLEFDLHAAPEQITERIREEQPDILGFSVYIWNVALVEKVLRRLRVENSHSRIVCGGPEAGYLPDTHPVIQLSDYRVCGEGEILFPELCANLLNGVLPESKSLTAPPPDLSEVVLPYEEYTEADLAHRMLYVESSRGCPFRCEYCLSSLDTGVRFFPLERLLPAFQRLLDRGARRFKFLDRCFNIRDEHALSILSFFQERYVPGLCLHLELIPDRLSPAFKEMVCRFPTGALHVEAGIQTYDPSVAERIHRKCDSETADANIRFMVQEARAVVHADLIAGLPGETLEGFAAGFDRLWKTGAQEIQVGILKRLHGAPIERHSDTWSMVYSSEPPYEIVQNSCLTAGEVHRIQHFADFWESLYNRRQFPKTMSLTLKDGPSVFEVFMKLSEFLYERYGRTHGLPMLDLMKGVFDYHTAIIQRSRPEIARSLLEDYLHDGKRSKPPRYLME